MFKAGLFQSSPDFWDAGFVARITAAQQVGQRWYYAFVEQWPQPQISASGDATAAPLYEDHPNARTGVIPGDGIGPYLTEINNRQLNVGDLVHCRHKTETPIGTVFEAEVGGAAATGALSFWHGSTGVTSTQLAQTPHPAFLTQTLAAGTYWIWAQGYGSIFDANKTGMFMWLSDANNTSWASGPGQGAPPGWAATPFWTQTNSNTTTLGGGLFLSTIYQPLSTAQISMYASCNNTGSFCSLSVEWGWYQLSSSGGGGGGGGPLIVGTTPITGGTVGDQLLIGSGHILGSGTVVDGGTF